MKNKLFIALFGAITVFAIANFLRATDMVVGATKISIDWNNRDQASAETLKIAEDDTLKDTIEAEEPRKMIYRRRRVIVPTAKGHEYSITLDEIRDKMATMDIPADMFERKRRIGILDDLIKAINPESRDTAGKALGLW